MSDLQPLLARENYLDEEWLMAAQGRCIRAWPVESEPYCGDPSDPASHYRFCTPHDAEARDNPAYGR
ncbi:hypothetical protein [Actinoplanes sp. URMC 104]|uniref:hypothetical protein n=1 Tax=Actinoplanes sp. URMC 104 TaxID=3423409 RepID=UPI003F1B25C7